MNKQLWIAVLVLLTLTSSAAGVALGQSGVAPAVLNINQAVPVVVTIAGANGQPQTVPLTVTVALQVRIDGRQVSAVALANTPASNSGAVLRDANGLSYRVDVAAPYALTQVQSRKNVFEGLDVIGEIKNTGPDTLKYVQVIVTFYKDARIIDTVNTFTTLDELAPGQSSPFTAMSMTPSTGIQAYTIQVQGRKK